MQTCPKSRGALPPHFQKWGGSCPPCPPCPTPLSLLLHAQDNYASTDTGHGAISMNLVTISSSSSSFTSDPPTFTLFGNTSGGPPTTYTWTRNGQVITNNATYSISLQVDISHTRFQNSHYRSTLTVTGRLPGVYQYSVTNRATSGMVTDQITIEGPNYLLSYRGIVGVILQ